MSLFHFEIRSTMFLLISLSIFNCGEVMGQSENVTQKVSGFIDFNGYYDTREFSVFTYNILANLPRRFQYFSLTNYQSPHKSGDFNTNYAEHNLRWGIGTTVPFDLTLQYVLRNGENNDDIRLGFRWRINQTRGLSDFFKKINMSYSMNPMLLQFRRHDIAKYFTQIEHVYTILIAPQTFGSRLYLGGFVDQNIGYDGNSDISFTWVTEHQLGFRILDQLYAVLEYRINEYYAIDNSGLGYGLEYKIIF